MSYFQQMVSAHHLPPTNPFQNQQQQQFGWEELSYEGKSNVIPKSKTLHMISELKPIRQKMLEEVMAKKGKWQEMKMSCIVKMKNSQMQSRTKQFVFREEYQSKIYHHHNQCYNQRAYENKNRDQPIFTFEQMDSKYSTIKSHLPSKLEDHPKLIEQESFQQHQQQQQMIMNNQIMLRLLSIVEKEREKERSTPMNNNNHGWQYQKQKESPIIINNILKTPMDLIDKSLIEKQMKIRVLQNARSYREYRGDESNRKPKSIQLNLNSNIKKKQSIISNDNIYSEIQNNESTERSFQNRKQMEIIEEIKKSDRKNSERNHNKNQMKQNIQFPNDNLNKRGEIKKIIEEKPKKRERHFAKERNKGDETYRQLPVAQTENESLLPSPRMLPEKQVKIQIKKPVLLEIPMNENEAQFQSVSLAEAFKKRLGKLSSEKTRIKKSPKKPAKIDEYSSCQTQKLIQNNQTMTQPLHIRDVKFISPSVSNSSIKPAKSTIHKPNHISSMESSKMTLKDPPKELLDRLIYGSKAKIDKKQMYALTRKNYEKLPQVEAKRKEELKKMKELERLNKIKEYQKQIRSNRSIKRVAADNNNE